DERLVHLLFGEAHRVEIRTMRRALRTFGHVAAGQAALIEDFGVHATRFPRYPALQGALPGPTSTGLQASGRGTRSARAPECGPGMTLRSARFMAESRRLNRMKRGFARSPKFHSRSVAGKQHCEAPDALQGLAPKRRRTLSSDGCCNTKTAIVPNKS